MGGERGSSSIVFHLRSYPANRVATRAADSPSRLTSTAAPCRQAVKHASRLVGLLTAFQAAAVMFLQQTIASCAANICWMPGKLQGSQAEPQQAVPAVTLCLTALYLCLVPRRRLGMKPLGKNGCRHNADRYDLACSHALTLNPGCDPPSALAGCAEYDGRPGGRDVCGAGAGRRRHGARCGAARRPRGR